MEFQANCGTYWSRQVHLQNKNYLYIVDYHG